MTLILFRTRSGSLRRGGAMVLCALCVLWVVAALSGCATRTGYGLDEAAAVQSDQQRQLAAKDKPDSAAVYLGLIEQMQQKQMYFASLAHLDQYEHTYGVSPKTTLMRADALRATDQLAASTAAYQSLIGTPLAAQGYRGLGLIAGTRGDFDAAAQSLAKATEANPTDAQSLSDLAYALMRSGNLADARVPIMKAAELDQKNPKVMSNLAIFLLAQGQARNANGLMDAQNMPREVRDAVRQDSIAVLSAVHARDRRQTGAVHGDGAAQAVAANNK